MNTYFFCFWTDLSDGRVIWGCDDLIDARYVAARIIHATTRFPLDLILQALGLDRHSGHSCALSKGSRLQ